MRSGHINHASDVCAREEFHHIRYHLPRVRAEVELLKRSVRERRPKAISGIADHQAGDEPAHAVAHDDDPMKVRMAPVLLEFAIKSPAPT